MKIKELIENPFWHDSSNLRSLKTFVNLTYVAVKFELKSESVVGWPRDIVNNEIYVQIRGEHDRLFHINDIKNIRATFDVEEYIKLLLKQVKAKSAHMTKNTYTPASIILNQKKKMIAVAKELGLKVTPDFKKVIEYKLSLSI